MSRLTIPVRYQTLWTTGDVRLWLDIDLDLKDDTGNFAAETCRLDSATDITTFPAFRARELNLPIPQRPNPGATHTQTGLEIRSGFLRFRIVGMDQTEYIVPCLFLGDPNTPLGPVPTGTTPRKLLQPLHLIEWLRFTMDKDSSSRSLYGDLIVEKK
jgi:hypothetical protein